MLNVYSIKNLGASVTGPYIYFQPVLVAIIATFFFSETITLQKIIAGIMIFAGVFLVGFNPPAPKGELSMKEENTIQFVIASSGKDFEEAKKLFREYAAHIGIDLCFKNFDKELEELQMQYSASTGGIILCSIENEVIGCAGIRRIDDKTAELKRMFIRPAYQGKGLGKQLLNEAQRLAKDLGYRCIRLDTLSTMKSAITIYKQNDFYEIPAYYFNPNNTVLFMEKRL